ncbi:MAG TPA: carboxypeptidase-like regulatory domain-containing protein, partial [Mucilaginibacter sp.]|nr:carboxypeptidase-like regulatory domain-containing protein [Mucilaginibacter sp.]
MLKLPVYIFLAVVLPFKSFAQFMVKGRVLNQADQKPVENVSIFLSNATIGDKTAADGSFKLRNVKPGRYDLVVTDIAFETYSQSLMVESNNISLPDIILSPRTRSLKEVTIQYRADPNREKYYNWFRDEFLGTSARAKECKILNPGVLDLSYDEDTHTLAASSYDFLLIENDALGYRIKYLVTDFSLKNNDIDKKEIYYKGPVLFEQIKGTPSQERRWERNRQEAYGNSAIHFLHAALSGRLAQEGFRVQRVAVASDPTRPPDSVIDARIKFFSNIKHCNGPERNSLAWWDKKLRSPKAVSKLMPYPLTSPDMIKNTGLQGQYAFTYENGGLLVGYNPKGHFHMNDHFDYLYNPNNNENTLIMFNSPNVVFYQNGVIAEPYSVLYYGVWGRNRVAEMLPVDYEPHAATNLTPLPAHDYLATKIDSFATTHPIEKAYLQFDKPYYAAGDTLYFKAYVTMGERHLPSQISGVLHADLINTKNKIDQSIKLQMANGIAWGDFALPDSLPKGNYRVRAWTQWMCNDPGSFFEKTIPIGSLQNDKVPESNTTRAITGKPDVQFFPEGGALVTGIKSRIAFKAIRLDGLGINIKGEILDNDNRTITTFASAHLGMGSFELTPESGKTYAAKLTFADGTSQTMALPKPEEKGITLSVNNDSIPLAKVKIIANGAYLKENKGKDYTLLIYSGGIATTVDCKLDSTVTTLDILKRKLFTGVTTITLFSSNNEPLCERLIFVQNYDQLDLNVTTDKIEYAPREKVTLKLNAKTRA